MSSNVTLTTWTIYANTTSTSLLQWQMQTSSVWSSQESLDVPSSTTSSQMTCLVLFVTPITHWPKPPLRAVSRSSGIQKWVLGLYFFFCSYELGKTVWEVVRQSIELCKNFYWTSKKFQTDILTFQKSKIWRYTADNLIRIYCVPQLLSTNH